MSAVMTREEQVLESLPAVERTAIVIAVRSGRPDLVEDLHQEGALALVEAIDTDRRMFNLIRRSSFTLEIATRMLAALFAIDPAARRQFFCSLELSRE